VKGGNEVVGGASGWDLHVRLWLGVRLDTKKGRK
jgi:hypothetical protein